jgi:hypothetical protein
LGGHEFLEVLKLLTDSRPEMNCGLDQRFQFAGLFLAGRNSFQRLTSAAERAAAALSIRDCVTKNGIDRSSP